MNNQPLILITNDDGINSPGLRATVRAVADLGELLIVAPSTQQTGASRSYPSSTIDKTIQQVTLPFGNGHNHPAYHANVSPAQSVASAVLNLAKRPIDLCISGINYGENIGSGVTISGTVGAAIEAVCYGIPALAVSFETPHEFHLSHSEDVDFSVAAHFTRVFAKKALSNGLPSGVDLLKIDVPESATPKTPWRVGRVSRQRYYESLPAHLAKSDKPNKSFDYRVNIDPASLEPDSDVKIFSIDRHVAVVPMTVDLTAPVVLPDVAQFFAVNGSDCDDHLS
jgi:5'-nucleotidase